MRDLLWQKYEKCDGKIVLKSNRVRGSERQQPEKHLVIRIKLLYNEKDWKKIHKRAAA